MNVAIIFGNLIRMRENEIVVNLGRCSISQEQLGIIVAFEFTRFRDNLQSPEVNYLTII